MFENVNYFQIKLNVIFKPYSNKFKLKLLFIYRVMEFFSGTSIFTQRNPGFRRITLGKLIFKTMLLHTENRAVLFLLSLSLSVMAGQPLVGLDSLRLLYEILLSHLDIPQSVGLLWTRNRPIAETST